MLGMGVCNVADAQPPDKLEFTSWPTSCTTGSTSPALLECTEYWADTASSSTRKSGRLSAVGSGGSSHTICTAL